MATYDYDRDNAEKTFEYMKYKRAQYALGIINNIHMNKTNINIGVGCGVTAAMYARPI